LNKASNDLPAGEVVHPTPGKLAMTIARNIEICFITHFPSLSHLRDLLDIAMISTGYLRN